MNVANLCYFNFDTKDGLALPNRGSLLLSINRNEVVGEWCAKLVKTPSSLQILKELVAYCPDRASDIYVKSHLSCCHGAPARINVNGIDWWLNKVLNTSQNLRRIRMTYHVDWRQANK